MLERRGVQRLGCRRQLGTSMKLKSLPLDDNRVQGQQKKHVTQQESKILEKELHNIIASVKDYKITICIHH